jgi:adenylate cyclase
MAPPRVVRGYELQERIGAGGFGEVYRAYQPAVGRQVAIKIILPQCANHPDFIRRFEAEARLIARLEHPHIVPLYDYWRDADTGGAYLAMRWLQGGNLYESLQRGPWAPEDAAQLLDQVAGALAVAHRQGIVHRDVKPENILLDADGNAYLSDFGIAKDLLRASRATAPDAVPGSLLYIAPEVAQGQAVTPQSDLYSLGVVMYEVLTGAHPFSDATPATLLVQLLNDPLPPLRAQRPDLPAVLEEVLRRATAKEPDDRYPDVLAFAEAFREAVFGTPRPAAADTEIPVQLPTFLVAEAEGELVERPVFVAREPELARLDEFLQMALSGQGRVAFVTGEAGSGKTSLLQEFARRAQDAHADLVFASGNCNAYTGVGDPYLPFRDVMGMLTGDLESRWSAGSITRDHARRLWMALPTVLQALVDHGPHLVDIFLSGAALLSRAAAAAGDGAPWLEPLTAYIERQQLSRAGLEQSYLFEQYTNLLRALAAEHPVLLLLDDLQWADTASIGLLFHIGRRLEGARVLIAGAYRPEEVALGRDGERHPLEKALAESKRSFGDVWIDLGQVEEGESREFVDRFLETEPNRLREPFRQALVRHTKGHPLFTIELLRAMRERGDLVRDGDGAWIQGPTLDWEMLPPRVEGVIEERVGRLGEELREILAIASVEGEEFTAQVVARVQETGERQLLRALSQQLEKRHRLVREQGVLTVDRRRLSRYRFAHALFQRYLYNDLSKGERLLLHGEIAAALEELYAGREEEIAAQLAQHYAMVGDAEREQRYARLAGERAAAGYAHAEAVRHLSRALELTPEKDYAARYAILLRREEAHDFLGEREAQRQDVVDLASIAESLEDPRSQAEVALRQANYAEKISDYPAAIAAAREAVRLAQATQDATIKADAYSLWASSLLRQGDFAAAGLQLEQALDVSRAARLRDLEARSLRMLGMVSALKGDYSGAEAFLQQALRIYRETGHHKGEALAILGLGNISNEQGDNAGARTCWGRALRIFRQIGDRLNEGIALIGHGNLASAQADYSAAQALYEQALRVLREVGDRAREGLVFLCLGDVSDALGDYASARRSYEQALHIFYHVGHRRAGHVMSRLGLLHHRLGDDERAVDYCQRALADFEDRGVRGGQADAWTYLGHVRVGLGDLEGATDVYQHALELRREMDQPHLATEPLAGLARVAMAQGDLAQAQVHVKEILAHLESGSLDGTGEPFRVYLTCYRVLRANGDPRAEELLNTAHRLLQEDAANIDDEGLRRSFLENVAAHRQILAAWGQVQGSRQGE